MDESRKRKSERSNDDRDQKKQKTRNKWHTTRPSKEAPSSAVIEPGDQGIWATCDMNREGRAIGELRDLLNEWTEKLYGTNDNAEDNDEGKNENDIEASLASEIQTLNNPREGEEPLLTNVNIDSQCVIFLKTRPPIDPSSIVHAICKDAAQAQKKRTRFLKRLIPMTLIGRASESSLEELAGTVLAPHFHGDVEARTYAIRPAFRNHSKILTREGVIKKVAEVVGKRHKVDLEKPELVIIVDVYKNVCGMSVVDGGYDGLKRYNLAELYQPSKQEPESNHAKADSTEI